MTNFFIGTDKENTSDVASLLKEALAESSWPLAEVLVIQSQLR